MQLCMLRCGNHICDRYAETPRSVGHCTIVFQKLLQRKRGDTRVAVYSAGPASVCLFMVRICPPVCLVVTRGYSGYDRSPVYSVSIYPFYGWCAADQCTWTCVDRQLYDKSSSSKVIACCCCSLRTRGIFANGVGALHMPAILNPYPDEENRSTKDWGLQPFRCRVHQYPISHMGNDCMLLQITQHFRFSNERFVP